MVCARVEWVGIRGIGQGWCVPFKGSWYAGASVSGAGASPTLAHPLPCMHSSCSGGEASRRLPSAAQCGPGRPPSSTFTFWSDRRTLAVLRSLSLFYPGTHPSLSLALSLLHTLWSPASYPPSTPTLSFPPGYLYVHTSISLLGALQQSAAAEGRSSVNCPRWTR